jgi:glycolate oxidase iron-sulfur subunit
MLNGCVQPTLAPQIDEAAARLLHRLGVEVVRPATASCCGSLSHHLGKTGRSHELARQQIAFWSEEAARGGLDAIAITTSGCGVTIKDYGQIFRNDPVWAERAALVSRLAVDVSELLERIGLDDVTVTPNGAITVAYHSACSLQHGQKVKSAPQRLLERAGFRVVEPAEAHICCGSAGTYNMLQPELAVALRDRKVAHLAALNADLVASGNIGCINQIASAARLPVVHTVELIDWATGGPRPVGFGG